MPADYPLPPIQLVKAHQGIPEHQQLYADLTAHLGEDPIEVAQRYNLHGIYRGADQAKLLDDLAAYLKEPRNKGHHPVGVEVMFAGSPPGWRSIVRIAGPFCDHTCPACKADIGVIHEQERRGDPLEMICTYLAALEDLLKSVGVNTTSLPMLPSTAQIDLLRSAGSLST